MGSAGSHQIRRGGFEILRQFVNQLLQRWWCLRIHQGERSVSPAEMNEHQRHSRSVPSPTSHRKENEASSRTECGTLPRVTKVSPGHTEIVSSISWVKTELELTPRSVEPHSFPLLEEMFIHKAGGDVYTRWVINVAIIMEPISSNSVHLCASALFAGPWGLGRGECREGLRRRLLWFRIIPWFQGLYSLWVFVADFHMVLLLCGI